MRRTVRGAFTLVEILIVVVILGILAAIVVPQFTNASDDAQAGNVATQLSTIRNQIELYRARNSGSLPDLSDWSVMINEGYLKSAPVNPRNNLSAVGAAAAADVGWWVDSGGEIFACYFDEAAYNDGDPSTPPWKPDP
jgi:type II secretion system protein G